jgi:hypothetical protein
MRADLTRNTFNAFLHYDRVVMQQGRVQLDADWNEQASILLHYMRTLAADLIGPAGGPKDHLGFVVGPLTLPGPAITNDFRIGLGRYYVDGILCEADSQPIAFEVSTSGAKNIQLDQLFLDGAPLTNNQLVEVFDATPNTTFVPIITTVSNVDPNKLTLTLDNPPDFKKVPAPRLRRVFTYLTQPDFPISTSAAIASSFSYLIYLDVWERLITHVENDAIREVALGGPDTTNRAKVIWQVKTLSGKVDGAGAKVRGCDTFEPDDPDFLPTLGDLNRGRIRAKAKQTAASTDPCIIPPGSSYSGPENQLYRVEIHRGGAAWDGTQNGASTSASFKWSRENGSVVYPILTLASGEGTTTVTLESLGRDDRFGLTQGDWVEIQDDAYVLQNRAEPMLQVQSVDPGTMAVTLTGSTVSNVGKDPKQHRLLRRWDYKKGDPALGEIQLASDNAALIQEQAGTAWLNLEDGIKIQFQPADTGQTPSRYRTGDYWLIPARTETGDIEWPQDIDKDAQGNPLTVPVAKPPDGIDHHYAPLAVISVSADGVSLDGASCQKSFPGLAQPV